MVKSAAGNLKVQEELVLIKIDKGAPEQKAAPGRHLCMVVDSPKNGFISEPLTELSSSPYC